MHPTYYAKAAEAEVAELKANIATLTARLDALAPPPSNGNYRDPALPAGHHRGPDGLLRDGRGSLIHAVAAEPYEVRHAAANAEHKQKQQAEHAKAREGLVGGLWRDASGIIRTPSGELASSAEIQARRADAVRAMQGQEQRERLRHIGLPARASLPAHVSLPVRRADPSDLAD
jgi:hypothetical protein